ncbi:condensation domain-containing protein [Gordonia sp. L191]|uniref:condensation domain-containing protein n=1 Tax=Gordonia sp. L191 TaxID=2982699 RepID=UPI0024C0582B|nr:condensation domain-containing protein [Gordonia sp. L191]WHU46336.1 condensation domain-containing protein [Gordonia sp. L191]
MRLGPAHEWAPASGDVVCWAPSERSLAAAAVAPPHPVGPSFLQHDHISSTLRHREAGREHRGFTCSVITVHDDLDTERMTTALTDFVRAHEGLRSSFRLNGSAVTRYVVDVEDVAFTTMTLGAIDPHQHLAQRLPISAVFDSWPGCAFGAVVRPGSFDLYYGVDHAYGDGASQILGIAEILARYRGLPDDPLVTHTHDSFLDHVAAEATCAAQVSAHSPGVAEWRRVLGRSGGTIPAFPLPLGLDSDDGGVVIPQPVYVDADILADSETTTRLATLANGHQTSMTAVIYAALGLALRSVADAEWYATAAVVSTRRADHYAGSQGWFCNFAPVGFEVAGDTLEDVLDDAAAALARSRAAASVPVHAALGVLLAEGAIDPAVVASPQMVTYLDLRWFPTPPNTTDLLVFTGEGRTSNASLWITRDEDGLRIITQRPDNPVASDSVSRWFRTLRDILAAAVAANTVEVS